MKRDLLLYEHAFLSLGALLLVVCGFALVYSTLAMGIQLPGRYAEIDPEKVLETPPFDRPGVRQVGDNEFEVVLTGQAWAFNPAQIRVPAGADVTFLVTSLDVIHGIHVDGTRVNLMLIPGHVSRNTYRFDRPGEHLLLCHEYCGSGHHLMYGTLIVE